MDRAGVGEACLALPGATMDHPFGPGHDAYKVGGKMFALIGAEGGLSLKVSDTAYEVLTEEGARRRPPIWRERNGCIWPIRATGRMTNWPII